MVVHLVVRSVPGFKSRCLAGFDEATCGHGIGKEAREIDDPCSPQIDATVFHASQDISILIVK
jgi:hypothetical protein